MKIAKHSRRITPKMPALDQLIASVVRCDARRTASFNTVSAIENDPADAADLTAKDDVASPMHGAADVSTCSVGISGPDAFPHPAPVAGAPTTVEDLFSPETARAPWPGSAEVRPVVGAAIISTKHLIAELTDALVKGHEAYLAECERNQEYPYSAGGQQIAELKVRPLRFIEFVNLRTAAGATARDEKTAQRNLQRGKVKKQVSAVTASGQTLTLSDDDISLLPIPYAKQLRDMLTDSLIEPGAGKAVLIGKGNGITSPITVDLGTPILFGGGKKVTALEFKAETLLDLEDVLSIDDHFDQTVALLKIAHPIGDDITALRLPETAFDALSFMDGVFTQNNVRPHFFDGPTSS